MATCITVFRGMNAVWIALLACAFASGCGGDDPKPSTQGTTGGSPGTATGAGSNTGGAAVTSTTANNGGSSATSTASSKPQTNLSATASVTVQNTATGAGLQLVSLNLVPDAASSLNYVEWFGEVKNTGTTTICYPTATFTFSSSASTALWTDTAYADTPPYLGSLTTSMPCLAPGETGAFWSNDLPSSPMTVSQVTALSVSLSGQSFTATAFAHQLSASAIADTIYNDGNHFAMSGTFTPQQTVYNISIAGYTKATAGLLTGHLTATNLGTVTANTAWPFKTATSIKGPQPAKILAYPEFILGSASVIFTDPAAANSAAAVNTLQSQRKAAQDAALGRAQLHDDE